MAGPSGKFLPWLKHELVDGRCLACGLLVQPWQTHLTEPTVAYTHYGHFLRNTPTGRIVGCAEATQEDR